ncbi:DUF427 domain-containing protein [Arthrobacter sp. H14]|uniref:DUF427 domain-containing protein n=1 Tax=Arthrobacter sp. H14 TaxID=1312959 RepID=UPI000688358D|nr:DUF427 domain-containing protein [Arthrobacter sp. H14]
MTQRIREPVPSARWVRGFIGNTLVVDSRDQLLIWEEELPVPRYLFQNRDVRPENLVPTGPPASQRYHHPYFGVTSWFDVVVGDRTIRHGAWRMKAFDGYTGVTWERGGLDHWYEEDQEVFEHPHDPFVHIDALSSSRLVTVSHNEVVIGESSEAVFLWETGLPVRYYLPRRDVDFESLVSSPTVSICPYKGFATDYWSPRGEDAPADMAWSYPQPFFPYRNIAGSVAFLNEKLDISIDKVLQPRPEPKQWPARSRLI